MRRWVTARVASGVGATLLRASFFWQVYAITGSEAMLGLIGLLSFLPAPVASLGGGVLADAFDRRRVILAAQFVSLTAAVGLTILAASPSLPLLYAMIVVNGAANAMEAPSRQAMLPTLVPRAEYGRAVTVMATAQSLAFMTGPALAGLVIGAWDLRYAYALGAAAYLLSLALVSGLPSGSASAGRQAMSMAGLLQGLRFVGQNRPVLAAMALDLFAVIFGGATALLPVFAHRILGVGAKGYGLLTASLEVGALTVALALVFLPPIRRMGRAVVLSVIVYGLATMLFGVSRSFPLSLAAYALVGMADQVSVVCRATIVQLSTPDELRGRVSSVNMIFIGASNQLSAAEAGFVAALTSATFSVVFGGAMVLVVVLLVVLLVPSLLGWRQQPLPDG